MEGLVAKASNKETSICVLTRWMFDAQVLQNLQGSVTEWMWWKESG